MPGKKIINKINDSNYNSDSDTDSEDTTNNEIDKKDIRNIIFKEINDDFSYGKYGNFSVILMKKNGYVNATKLCNSGGKKLIHWNENKSTGNLLSTLSKITNIPKHKLTIFIKGNNKSKISGIYVHPKLICPIAQWISSEFTFKVSDIVDEYIIKEATAEKNKLIKEKEQIIEQKDDKIDKLTKKIDKSSKNLKEILKISREMKEQNDEILDNVCADRVVPTGNSKDIGHFIILNNGIDLDDYDDDDDVYEYTAFRILRNSYNQAYNKHKSEYPKCKIVIDISGSPNSVVLWKRIKNKLGDNITVSGSHFNLNDDYTEKKLIKDVNMIHNDRYNIDGI
jgi:hypothetical protein